MRQSLIRFIAVVYAEACQISMMDISYSKNIKSLRNKSEFLFLPKIKFDESFPMGQFKIDEFNAPLILVVVILCFKLEKITQ